MQTEINSVVDTILDCSFAIHRALGPGLDEKVYETILSRDLSRKGLSVEWQKPWSFNYDGMWFENAFRVDLFVEGLVVVELKSAKALTQRDRRQLQTYLKIMDVRLGLLINFGEPYLKLGIRRIANGY